MDRYIGLDVHSSSCTLAVVGPSGKRLGSQVVETNAGALIEVLRGIPKQRHMCMEEGTLSEWLHEVLEPHVEELVVTGIGKKSRGPKSDKKDAFGLAEQLRIGSIETRVYKGRGQFGRLGNLARAYGFLVGDTVRVKNRLRSVLRSRGVGYGAGRSVYSKRDRDQWLGELPEATRALAAQLYEEHDALVALREKAEKTMLAAAKKHREWHVLGTCPGLGPIRVAELLPVVVTPYRFRSRSGFWAYCGLGIVMRSSSDWVRTQTGEWVKMPVREPAGRRHETEPGEADDRTSDRIDYAGALAHGREVRPDEVGSDEVDRARNDERGVKRCDQKDGSDEPRANRLQGKASIGILGWAWWPESPGIGYAPLESRTKRWATEPQIEGWFPLPSGERHGCDGLSDCDAEPASAPTLSRRTGNSKQADACGKNMGRRRVVVVCLDLWPHRR